MSVVASAASLGFRWHEALLVGAALGGGAAAAFRLRTWHAVAGLASGSWGADRGPLGQSRAWVRCRGDADQSSLCLRRLRWLARSSVCCPPRIGPVATIAMLLTDRLMGSTPVTALIMLAGIYYGAYLRRVDTRRSWSICRARCHRSSRFSTGTRWRGRAAPAPRCRIAALGSFFAGSVATVVIAMFAPLLADLALKFDAAEYFSLMVLGLVSAVALAHGSVLKAILDDDPRRCCSASIGTDVNSGVARFFLQHAGTDRRRSASSP